MEIISADDSIQRGCARLCFNSHSIISWPCNALSPLMFARISTRVSVQMSDSKFSFMAIVNDRFRILIRCRRERLKLNVAFMSTGFEFLGGDG